MRRPPIYAFPLAFAALLAAPLLAQRGNPTLQHQKLECSIDYGVVGWGRHSLGELAIGQNWRLGMNEASSWQTQLPIVQGDTLVAPGGYRVALERSAADSFRLILDSAGLSLGETASAGLSCQMSDGKEAKKLEIDLAAGKAKKGDGQGGGTVGSSPHLPAHLQVRFGPHQLDSDFTLVGGRELAATPRFRLVGWYLPAEVVERQLERGAGVPIATLFPKKRGRAQDPSLFNIVVTKDGASVVPGMTMPTESFGFGAVEPPSPEARQAGRVEWSEGAPASEQLVVDEARFDKSDKGFALTIRAGQRRAQVVVPEPRIE